MHVIPAQTLGDHLFPSGSGARPWTSRTTLASLICSPAGLERSGCVINLAAFGGEWRQISERL
jgi:hypothetical protein